MRLGIGSYTYMWAIGFPGARYDYRDWVERHNQPYPLPPVSIMGRSDWGK